MNETTVTTVKAAIAAAVATMTALWGWFGWLVIAWVLLMLADWLIGSAAAAKEGRWSSAKMREGAWHKGGMILVVCIALVADWLIGSILGHIPAVSLPFDYSVLLAPLVIVWYIIGELGSLAEHAVTFGRRCPPGCAIFWKSAKTPSTPPGRASPARAAEKIPRTAGNKKSGVPGGGTPQCARHGNRAKTCQ